ncbi:MAG: NAD(P)/FAD-dependent oxidoreductase [Candidatus Puniceispirillaceae bacterium]
MRIAVIGAGISGLGAAWLLGKEHDVTIFEKQDRIGGHSHTVDVSFNGENTPVDTGFIVYNELNYPNLVGLFSHLQVPTKGSEMTFAVSLRDKTLEYEGTLKGLTAQLSNLFKPRYWSMLNGLRKFYAHAYDYSRDSAPDETLGEFIERCGFSDAFVEDHLLPMGAAIWSCPADTMLSFPARSFIQFMQNHKLMNYIDRPVWRTVDGGSREYVTRLLNDFRGQIVTNANITSIRRDAAGVFISLPDEGEIFFDKVIMAAHADESLALMSDANEQEKEILSCFGFQPNEVILHSDETLMPQRKATWAAWNYLTSSDNNPQLSVTYWMNKLQSIEKDKPLFVTLNPFTRPEESLTHRVFSYDHPIFDKAAILAQNRLGEIQGQNHLYFCGAWTKYGFHEDGLSSAIKVVKSLGVDIPWNSSTSPWHKPNRLTKSMRA